MRKSNSTQGGTVLPFGNSGPESKTTIKLKPSTVLEDNTVIEKVYENIKDKEVEIPPRVRLGGNLGFLDELLGGKERPGLLVGGSYFITGDPNAGKTTITFQMADQLTSQGHIVMYNNTEMIESMIKMVQERLELNHGFGLFACDTDDDVDDEDFDKMLESIVDGTDRAGLTPDMHLMKDFIDQCRHLEQTRGKSGYSASDEKVKAYQEERKKFPGLPPLPINNDDRRVVLFIDSVQSLAENSDCNPKEVVYRFVKLAQKLKAIVVFIGQATKSGQFAGSNKLPHKVTTHVHISVVANEGEHQIREVATKKNRAGPCNFVWTRLTQLGHVQTEVEYGE